MPLTSPLRSTNFFLLASFSFFIDRDWEVSVVESTTSVVSHETLGFVLGGECAEIAVSNDFRLADVDGSPFLAGIVLILVVNHCLKTGELTFVSSRTRQSRWDSKNWRYVEFDRICVEEESPTKRQ